MNIPFIVDLAIGLIFIYLILSLLTSEIQEIMATLLQWRAQHLKNSIEILMSGGIEDDRKLREAEQLADKLYCHPLINTLNHEAKGKLANSFRKVGHAVMELGQKLTKSKKIFGKKRSGPSYIPSETFATSLIETLRIKELANILSSNRLNNFKEDRLKEIVYLVEIANFDPSIKMAIENEIQKLSLEMDAIVDQFKEGYINLDESIYSLALKISFFIGKIQNNIARLPEGKMLINQLNRLRKEQFGGESQRSLIVKRLKPSMGEVVEGLRQNTEIAREIQAALQDKDSEAYKSIQALMNSLPDSLQDSLAALGKKIQTQAVGVQEDLNEFQKEVENWFDRSMDRASGVYKRNARGIAILLGCVVATIANADTLNIINRLSNDSVIRRTISIYAEELVENNAQANQQVNPQALQGVESDVRNALNRLSLPIGWNQINLEQQQLSEQNWPVPYSKRLVGWLISGLAISMGSSFWFDLLNKVVNIKNMGKKS
ncbi:MAG: hypothetical protein F6J93_25350 [Oscillatoria sp. SIO1A7]|nr:hypothetical protein [Oscillatoria sp. SIO1A7]